MVTSQPIDEYNREERINTYYQGWGARDMAERIVALEDELGANVDGICTGMHADVAEALDEIERLRAELSRHTSAWKSARRRARHTRGAWNAAQHAIKAWRRMCRGQTDAMRDLIAVLDERRQERDRYRLAWTSARRRAADEANFAMEALELRDQEIARLRAALQRKSTHAAESSSPPNQTSGPVSPITHV